MERNNSFMSRFLHHLKKSRGFTLVEMAVVAPIIILVIGTTVFSIVQLTGLALTERSTAEMADDVSQAMQRIEEDIRTSAAFLAQTNITPTSPQGFNNSTTPFTNVTAGASDDKLILNMYLTSANPQSLDRSLVYLPNQPNACGNPNIQQNTPANYNVVYYVENNSLWRRSIMNNNYLTNVCAGVVPWQLSSCAPGQSGTMCLTTDEEILKGVATDSFSVNYFINAADTTYNINVRNPSLLATRQSIMDNSRAAKVYVRSVQTLGGRDVAREGTIVVNRQATVFR